MWQSLIIIPILGMLKNYVKYKRVSILLFMRTPIIYIFLYSFFTLLKYSNRICMTIINERIFMFLYKIVVSLLTDNYNKKKLNMKKNTV